MKELLEDIPLVFQDPLWLLLLLLAPVIWLYRARGGKPAALQFPSVGLVSRIAKQTRYGWSLFPKFLPLIGVAGYACLSISLARPKWRKDVITEKETLGIDIVLAIDLSGSMWAHDFKVKGKPTDRLTVVKNVVKDFIGTREDDRIGIVAFAGAPYLVSPLTLNHDWVMENLARLKIGSIPEQGTAIGSAIGMAANRLQDQTGKSRLVILLTDGANNTGQIEPTQAAEAAASFGIKVYTIGAGEQGEVPFPRLGRDGMPMMMPNGEPILARAQSEIDLETLWQVSELTGAKSYHAKETKALSKIYKEIDELEKTKKKVNVRYNYRDIFAWPLALGLGLLLFEQSLSNTRYRRLP
jgi:Ca-activated chloride channel family protein